MDARHPCRFVGVTGATERTCVTLLDAHGVGLESALATRPLLRGFTFRVLILLGLPLA
jgi:hypothetical protein